jgi:hypothetical protein
MILGLMPEAVYAQSSSNVFSSLFTDNLGFFLITIILIGYIYLSIRKLFENVQKEKSYIHTLLTELKDIFFYTPLGRFSPQKQRTVQEEVHFLVETFFYTKSNKERQKIERDTLASILPMHLLKFLLTYPYPQQKELKGLILREAILKYNVWLCFVMAVMVNFFSIPLWFAILWWIKNNYVRLFGSIIPTTGKTIYLGMTMSDGTILLYPFFIYWGNGEATSHECIHRWQKEGYIRYDIPAASAVGILRNFRRFGRRNLTLEESRNFFQGKIFLENFQDNIEKRWEKFVEILDRDISYKQLFLGLYDARTQNCSQEEEWSYQAGGILAGMAESLSYLTGSPQDAWEYLRIIAQTGDPIFAENYIKNQNKPKENNSSKDNHIEEQDNPKNFDTQEPYQ